MRRRYWNAVAAYVVPTFLLGYVWHLQLFAALYERLGIYRADVIIPFGLASMLVQALFFAWAYPRLFDTAAGAWLRSACVSGAFFGLLSWSFTTVAVAAKHPMTSASAFVGIETVFTLVQFGVAAPLLALAWRGAPARAVARASAALPLEAGLDRN